MKRIVVILYAFAIVSCSFYCRITVEGLK